MNEATREGGRRYLFRGGDRRGVAAEVTCGLRPEGWRGPGMPGLGKYFRQRLARAKARDVKEEVVCENSKPVGRGWWWG